jgi:hypothetical protein
LRLVLLLLLLLLRLLLLLLLLRLLLLHLLLLLLLLRRHLLSLQFKLLRRIGRSVVTRPRSCTSTCTSTCRHSSSRGHIPEAAVSLLLRRILPHLISHLAHLSTELRCLSGHVAE